MNKVPFFYFSCLCAPFSCSSPVVRYQEQDAAEIILFCLELKAIRPQNIARRTWPAGRRSSVLINSLTLRFIQHTPPPTPTPPPPPHPPPPSPPQILNERYHDSQSRLYV